MLGYHVEVNASQARGFFLNKGFDNLELSHHINRANRSHQSLFQFHNQTKIRRYICNSYKKR